MNHLTLYGYEEDGKLFVYRCPECGSSGPQESGCPHDPSPAEGNRDLLLKRVPVRVPGVREEPRYTLEQVRAGLPGDGARAVLENERGMSPDRILECLLDHFTQLPAGVGADDPDVKGASTDEGVACTSSSGVSNVSADSDGNQQPQGGRQEDVLEVAEEVGAALESGKEQVDKGGDAAHANGGPTASLGKRPHVAEGDSVQCDGVALEQLLGWVEEHRRGARTIGDWLTGAMALQEVADEIRRRITKQRFLHGPHSLDPTQQSSGGQEGGVEEGLKAWLESEAKALKAIGDDKDAHAEERQRAKNWWAAYTSVIHHLQGAASDG